MNTKTPITKTYKNVLYFWVLLSIVSFGITLKCNAQSNPKIAFEISMERPGNHYYQVTMACEGLQNASSEFKMPVWTPGYYKVNDYSKNLTNFKAISKEGQILTWTKSSKNTWLVNNGNYKNITVSYEVYGANSSVVDPFLDEGSGFISPTGLYLYLGGNLNLPADVVIKPAKGMSKVSTGLDPVPGKEFAFHADNFDQLYDCPILIGNQEVLTFSVKGITHEVAIENADSTDKKRFVSNLAKIVKAASDIVGDIPYKHYTFLIINNGGGGMEHCNSTALSCTGPVNDTTDMESYRGWLSFIAHEYFHLYNVKTIRPIALGPFDYDKENYTNLLWFSEGGTVYYESLILNRAGLMNRAQCFKETTQSILGFERKPGHLLESAEMSSFDAWIHFFSPGGDPRNNTISYYDKGATLTLFLDLKIRTQTQNKKSLDDVMKTLYFNYYKGLKRGFTDAEFKKACEDAAGTNLDEIFNYASSTHDLDYPKYFTLAGLQIDTTAREISGKTYLGFSLREEADKLIITNVERNSPAWNAGLGNQAIILSADGNVVSKDSFNQLLDAKKPGETIKLMVQQRSVKREIVLSLSKMMEKSFAIIPSPNASKLQSEVLNNWIKN